MISYLGIYMSGKGFNFQFDLRIVFCRPDLVSIRQNPADLARGNNKNLSELMKDSAESSAKISL